MTLPAAPSRCVSLCVGTFKRPQGIVKAVQSLLAQHVPAGTAVEILVVDNDPAGSARPGLAPWLEPGPDNRPAALRYFIEPTSGVSHVRNRCLREARGDVVAFIDDDEWAEPDWLGTLLNTLDRTGADAVFGPVLPHPEETPPSWLTGAGLHNATRMATGTVIPWGHAKTGNVAMRRRFFDGTEGFSSRFARTGGEDSYFFAQAIQRGLQLVWCDEAIVHESVPAARMSKRWVLQRAFHGGRTYVRLRRELDMPWAYAYFAVYGVVLAALLTPVLLLTALIGHPRHMFYACKWRGHWGKVVAKFYDAGHYG